MSGSAPRYLKSDGGQSLAKNFTGFEGTVLQRWRRNLKPEVYPLLGIMGGAFALIGWVSTRHLASSPNVQINKYKRKQTLRYNAAEGERWVKHHESMRQLVPKYSIKNRISKEGQN
eukprot:maker-scaffold_17-snap-gene-3.35-mRNA-1 protein AED:0.12 eAED:0.12 QI:100/1/1/1/0.33/0/4/53/115